MKTVRILPRLLREGLAAGRLGGAGRRLEELPRPGGLARGQGGLARGAWLGARGWGVITSHHFTSFAYTNYDLHPCTIDRI